MNMRHLRRAVVSLVVVLIVIFVGPKIIPTEIKANLQDYGFYPNNSAINAALWAAQPLKYADPTTCNGCHTAKSTLWTGSKHKTVSCENCHGPGESHRETMIPLNVDPSKETCTVCHARLLSRPSSFPQVDVSQHAGEATCVTCHNPHKPEFK